MARLLDRKMTAWDYKLGCKFCNDRILGPVGPNGYSALSFCKYDECPYKEDFGRCKTYTEFCEAKGPMSIGMMMEVIDGKLV